MAEREDGGFLQRVKDALGIGKREEQEPSSTTDSSGTRTDDYVAPGDSGTGVGGTDYGSGAIGAAGEGVAPSDVVDDAAHRLPDEPKTAREHIGADAEEGSLPRPELD
ncbi:MAG: hypothetical protein ACR2KI_01690 [Candidatus Limnocylindria bacterium]